MGLDQQGEGMSFVVPWEEQRHMLDPLELDCWLMQVSHQLGRDSENLAWDHLVQGRWWMGKSMVRYLLEPQWLQARLWEGETTTRGER